MIGSRFPLLPLKFWSDVPIVNGVGEAAREDRRDWPRYVRITDIATTRKLKASTFKSLPPQVARQAALRPNDLLLAAVGASYGKSYLHHSGEDPACFAGYLVRVRLDETGDARFVAYWAESTHFWHQVESQVVQSTIQNFSAGKYRQLRVPAPPLPTQRAIADFLDRKTAAIDALIEKKERFLELLAEKRAALIHRAVTKGLDPSVPMKDSGVPWIGEIPEHWAFCRLSFRYEQQLGKMLSKEAAEGPDQRLYLGNKDVQWDHVDVSDLKTMSFSAADRSKFVLRPGDLLVCEGGIVGRTAIWRSELGECYFQKAIHRLRPLQPADEDPRFFYYCMRAATKRGLFEEHGNKATIGHLTGEALRAHRFPFPPKLEQAAIAEELDRLVGTMKATEGAVTRHVGLLREYRQALITAAVTGQLDIEAANPQPIPENDDQLGMFGDAR